jgi:hypothetical protein
MPTMIDTADKEYSLLAYLAYRLPVARPFAPPCYPLFLLVKYRIYSLGDSRKWVGGYGEMEAEMK